MKIRSPYSESEWEAYFDLRYRVLREPLNQPKGSERNEGDSTGKHFAIFAADKIIAISRLDQVALNVAQIRFVAVDYKQRGKGYGRILMDAVEKEAIRNGNTKIILHARDYAVDFYLQLDYTRIEKSYILYNILQHYLMEKRL